jgi:hypothetical protein
MKTLFYSIFFTFVIAGHFNCFSQTGYVEVNLYEIKIIDNRIDSLLNNVIQNTEEFRGDYLLYVTKKESDYYITISITGTIDYIYSLGKSKLLGFCTVNNQDIFVMNKFYSQKMKFLGKAKKFTFSSFWLENQNNYPPPPPPLSNSTYFNFLLKKNGDVISLKK